MTQVELCRLICLKYALRLETKGLKRRGRSAFKIIKDEFGYTGSKEEVLKIFEDYLEQVKAEAEYIH